MKGKGILIALAGKPKGGEDKESEGSESDSPGAAASALVKALDAVRKDPSDENAHALHAALEELGAACEASYESEEADEEDE